MFPIILTDNGSEFSNPKSIEYGADGTGFRRTRIYYCNPSAPYQKAEIEVGHEFIRRVLPKGKSFDELMQEDMDLMMDHINSYRRKKLNGKSPYEAFCFYYGKDLADKMGCHEVGANSSISKCETRLQNGKLGMQLTQNCSKVDIIIPKITCSRLNVT